MFASNTYITSQDIFNGKSQTVRDLYDLLVEELNKLGSIKVTRKALTVSFKNRKPFASVLIRNRSIKLALRIQHRIANQRFLSISRVNETSFDHTVIIDSKYDIDNELMKWLREAYQSGK